MRLIITWFLFSVWLAAQTTPPSSQPVAPPASDNAPRPATEDPDSSTAVPGTRPAPVSASPAASPKVLSIPAGTKIALELKHAISTKGTEEGAAVYAQTTFPFALNDRILVPAGTYVQGRITHIERAGRIRGRAEVLMHFTTLIYPSGYTVVLPGSLENAPGVDKTRIKDQEGTIQQDSQAGDEATTIGGTAVSGAAVGALSRGSLKAGLIGAGVGGAVGTAVALLSRGRDLTMPSGTTFEMVIQREVTLDPGRIAAVTK